MIASANKNKKRVIGLLKDQVPQIPDDAWDFPEDLTDMMEGRPRPNLAVYLAGLDTGLSEEDSEDWLQAVSDAQGK